MVGTAERCRECSRRLSEHSERYPGHRYRESPRTPSACEDLAISLTGGCALRAYPRLHSLHRSAVPAARIRDRNYEKQYLARAKRGRSDMSHRRLEAC